MDEISLQDHPVFLVDDERQNLVLLRMWVEKLWKLPVREFDDPQACLDNLAQEPCLILLDIMMPKIDGIEILKRVKAEYPHIPVVMLSAQNSVQVAIDAIHYGAYDYLEKPVDRERLEVVTRNAIREFELAMKVRQMQQRLAENAVFPSIVSIDRRMQEVFRLVRKSANSLVSILIEGESGTGKDLIATALHQIGNRSDKPFVVVNCAAIPSELLESELFGHEKGAFTGADTQKIGKFEAAHGGTLFLDEIGTMEYKLQAKVLRAIQQKEFSRVGGLNSLRVDVRIISATNSDLKSMVKDGTFREDLYYRLATFPISIPPLRERKDDIVLLAEHFLEKSIDRQQKDVRGFSKEAILAMTRYPWPGNVRELQSVVERSILLTEDPVITLDCLPIEISAYGDDGVSAQLTDTMFKMTSPNDLLPFESFKKSIIRKAFELCEGNISEVAQRLSISRTTVYRLLEEEDLIED
ncbi:MAG: sigma-54-dependent Fis family transcriptional regulator [Ignavibacteriae bacterium]|nr:sigma-54-dependent Fis family transcriptional regulator [Ignavibacteriota bacterium]